MRSVKRLKYLLRKISNRPWVRRYLKLVLGV